MTTAAGALTGVDHPRRWYALGVLCLALGMVALDNTILNVAIPNIASQLGASESDLQWITTGYGLVLAGLLLPLAVFGDRRGRKGLLMVGLAVFGAASALAAAATSPFQLALCRGAMGVGGAAAMPATLSLLGNLFAEGERGRALAIWTGTAGMASAAGPVIGGLLLARWWWGAVFLVNVPVAAAGLVAAAVLVPRSTDPGSPRLDGRSALTWWAALSATIVAVIEGPVRGWSSPPVIAAAAIALGLFLAFVGSERRSSRPLIGRAAASDHRMQAGAGALGAMFFAMFGCQFVVTQWLQTDRGHTALFAGLCFLPSALASVGGSVVNPRLAVRIGHDHTAGLGLSVIAAGAGAAAAAIAGDLVIAVPVAMALVGAGVGLASPSGSELIMSSVPPARAGLAAGVNETVVEASGALGVAVLGTVLAAGAGYAWPLPVAALVAVTAAAMGWRARRPRRRGRSR